MLFQSEQVSGCTVFFSMTWRLIPSPPVSAAKFRYPAYPAARPLSSGAVLPGDLAIPIVIIPNKVAC